MKEILNKIRKGFVDATYEFFTVKDNEFEDLGRLLGYTTSVVLLVGTAYFVVLFVDTLLTTMFN